MSNGTGSAVSSPGTASAYGVCNTLPNFFIAPDMKETDIKCVSISHDKSLMAVADALGRAKVYCYPAYLPRQNSLSLETGHPNNVISAQFMPDDSFLVTSGENDCTIMVWAYKAYD